MLCVFTRWHEHAWPDFSQKCDITTLIVYTFGLAQISRVLTMRIDCTISSLCSSRMVFWKVLIFGQSKGTRGYNFLQECVEIAFLTKIWSNMFMPSSKHTLRGHLWAFQQDASLNNCHLNWLIYKTVDRNHRDVYAELPTRFVQKSRWTVIAYNPWWIVRFCIQYQACNACACA